MKRPSLLLTLIVTMLGMSGCGGPGAIRSDYTLQGKRIAVVSELGNNFHRIVVGTTVFGNSTTRTDVKDWRINHQAASHLVARLSKQGLNATEVESDLFTPLDGSSPYAISRVADQVVAQIKPQGYDNLLIISPVTSTNYPFFYPGYGLNTEHFFGQSKSCIYAIFLVRLYDLRTDQEIGWEWMNAGRGPCERDSAADLALNDSLEAYSAPEQQEIRRRIEQRVIQSLDATVDKLQLVR